MDNNTRKLFAQLFTRLHRLKAKVDKLMPKRLDSCKTCAYLDKNMCSYEGDVEEDIPECEKKYR